MKYQEVSSPEGFEVAIVGMAINDKGLRNSTEYWEEILQPGQAQQLGKPVPERELARHALEDAGYEHWNVPIFTDTANPFNAILQGIRSLALGESSLSLVSDVHQGQEFGAMLVLKTLAEAQRDGDCVFAVLDNVQISPGEVENKITPSLISQMEVVGLDVEDNQQLRFLQGCAGPMGLVPNCSIGESDSPLSALIKVALCLYRKVLPKTLAQPNYETSYGSLYFNQKTRPWIRNGSGQLRQGAVAMFDREASVPSGYTVLAEFPSQVEPGSGVKRSLALMLFGADGRAKLLQMLREAKQRIEMIPDLDLLQYSQELMHQCAGGDRLAIVTRDKCDFLTKLDYALGHLEGSDVSQLRLPNGIYFADAQASMLQSKTAFLFPGFGSEYPNMCEDLCLGLPRARALFDILDELDHNAQELLSRIVFPPTSSLTPEMNRLIAESLNLGSPASNIASFVYYETLQMLGVHCDVMVGHSNGENSALIASGKLSATRQSYAMFTRAVSGVLNERSMTEAEGQFLVVNCVNRASLEELLHAEGNRFEMVLDNCKTQVILWSQAGPSEEVAQRFSKVGATLTPIQMHHPFHTRQFQAKANKLTEIYERLSLRPGHTPVYSVATVQPFGDTPSEIGATALEQWTSPVRFRQVIERLYREGVRTFVEVGSGCLLTGFVEDILKGQDHVAVSCDRSNRGSLEQLFNLVGQLFVLGKAEAPLGLYDGNGLKETVVPHPVLPCEKPLQTELNPAAGSVEEDRMRILEGHFKLMQEFMAVQARSLQAFVAWERQAGSEGVALPLVADHPSAPTLREVGPFIGEVLQRDENELYFEWRFDLQRDLVVRDHVLGSGPASSDHALLPLAVVPMALSMEIMAEAALELCRGRSFNETCLVCGLREIRSHRWLALDQDTLLVGVRARRISGKDSYSQIHVQIHEIADMGSPRLAVESVVDVAPAYPKASASTTGGAIDSAGAFLAARSLYQKYLFHGPSLQGIHQILDWHQKGFTVELRVPSTGLLRADLASPDLALPVALSDCVGQMIGLWLLKEHRYVDFAFFPIGMGGFTMYQQPCPTGSRVLCRGTCTLTGNGSIVSFSGEFLDDENRLLSRIEDFRGRVFFNKIFTHIFSRESPTHGFTDPMGTTVAGQISRFTPGSLRTFVEDFVWKRAVAYLCLNREERKLWHELDNEGLRTRWLLERLTAKEAVCQWAYQELRLSLTLFDVALSMSSSGSKVICEKLQSETTMPWITINHDKDTVVATVGYAIPHSLVVPAAKTSREPSPVHV